MTKTTIKSFITFLCVFSVLTINAQQGKHLPNSQQQENSQENKIVNNTLNSEIELTEESRRSLAETGKVRCTSLEMHERRMEREGNTQSNEAFEEWLAPKIEAHKQLIAEQKANGTFRMAVTNIPIIFHIITMVQEQKIYLQHKFKHRLIN